MSHSRMENVWHRPHRGGFRGLGHLPYPPTQLVLTGQPYVEGPHPLSPAVPAYGEYHLHVLKIWLRHHFLTSAIPLHEPHDDLPHRLS